MEVKGGQEAEEFLHSWLAKLEDDIAQLTAMFAASGTPSQDPRSSPSRLLESPSSPSPSSPNPSLRSHSTPPHRRTLRLQQSPTAYLFVTSSLPPFRPFLPFSRRPSRLHFPRSPPPTHSASPSPLQVLRSPLRSSPLPSSPLRLSSPPNLAPPAKTCRPRPSARGSSRIATDSLDKARRQSPHRKWRVAALARDRSTSCLSP